MKSSFRFGLLMLCWCVVLWLCIWGGGRSAWFLCFGLSAFIFYVLCVKIFALRSVTVTRKLDNLRYIEGDDVSVHVTLRLRSWFPLAWFTIDEPWIRNEQICCIHHKAFFMGFTRELRYQYVLKDVPRGVYRAMDPFVTVGDAFGIVTNFCSSPSILDCTVVPHSALVVNRSDLYERRDDGQVAQATSLVLPDQIKGLRAYVPGDPINRIHWKASAKGLGLQTIEHEMAADQEMMLLLDTSHASEKELEQAIRISAGWMKQLHDGRYVFRFAALQSQWMLPQERLTWQQGLDLLAALQPAEASSSRRFDELLVACGNIAKAHTRMICILSQMDDAFVRAAQMLRHRNIGVHVIWLHPKLLHHRDRQWMKELRHLGCSLEMIPTEPSADSPLGLGGEAERIGVPY